MIGGNFGYVKKTEEMPDALADFEASAYKCTQVRRNPKMESKTTLTWVALPKDKEPSVVSAETCEASEYK